MAQHLPQKRTLAVIRIPFMQDSVDYRAYAEPLARSSVLEWAIGRLTAAIPNDAVTVCVCASQREHDRLVAAHCPLNLTILHRSAASEVHQCRALMDEFRACRIIGLRLIHAVLAVGPLLQSMLRMHDATGATLTEASAPALATSVYVIDSSAVNTLSAADTPGSRTELLQVVSDFKAYVRESSRAAAASRWFRLEMAEILNVPAERWPEAIRLNSSADVSVLREAVDGGEPSPQGCAHYIDRWKTAAIAVRRADRKRHAEADWAAAPRCHPASSNRRRRVLYISGTSYFHGASRSLCHLIEGLDRRRYEPFVVIPFEGVLTTELRRRGATVICPNHSLNDVGGAALSLAGRLVRDAMPDVAHGNYDIGMPLVSVLAATGVPVVQHVRQPVFRDLMLEIHTASAIIAVSDLVKRRLLALDIASDDVSVIWPGIDTNEFKPSSLGMMVARRSLGLPPGEFIVAAIGRMTRYKRHETVIDALRELRRATNRGHLLFVSALDGDRPYYDEIFSRIRDGGLTPHVTHIEFTKDIPTVLEASNVLAMMSRDEAFGRVAAEAMAVGRPVVVANATGASEIIEHGVNGYVVPYQNAMALSLALEELASDPVRAERIGTAAARTIETRLSAARSAELTMAIYDRVIDEYAGEVPDLRRR